VQVLKQFGLPVSICPQQQFDSEGLLKVEELRNVAGKRILIFRGEGGRRLLGDTLQQRGAIIEYAEVYRRAIPTCDIGKLLHQFESGSIDVITVISLESLNNLIEMVGDAGKVWLRKLPMIVVNRKMVALIHDIGGGAEPVLADNATDQAVLEALLAWGRSLK
jgi:uroporphyrinogen-III synthase